MHLPYGYRNATSTNLTGTSSKDFHGKSTGRYVLGTARSIGARLAGEEQSTQTRKGTIARNSIFTTSRFVTLTKFATKQGGIV